MTQPESKTRAFGVDQLIGLLIALAVPALIVWVRTVGMAPTVLFEQRLVSTIAFWGTGVLLLFWIGMAEQRPLVSIGLGRPTLRVLGWGLAAGVAFSAFATLLLWAEDRFGLLPVQAPPPSADLTQLPLVMRLAMVITSGFAEELLFVAYPISRLLEATRRPWLAVLIPGAVFVALHIPGRSPGELVMVACVMVLMSLLFLWRRSLWTNMVAHGVMDFAALVIQPVLMGQHG